MKSKKIINKLVFISIIFLIVLLFIEVTLRIKDIIVNKEIEKDFKSILETDVIAKHKRHLKILYYMYYDEYGCLRMVPNVTGFHISCEPGKKTVIKINSEGIRGPELLDSPEKRILFLGDSIIFSGGVPLVKTFVYRLEKFLNNNKKERKDFNIEVLNFGTSDAGIDEYYLKLKHHGVDLNPDFVFLEIYSNDSISPQGCLGANSLDFVERFFESEVMLNFELAGCIENVYRKIKYSTKKDFRERFRWAKRYLKKKYHQDKNEFIKLVEEADLDWGAGWIPESWNKIKFYLEKIKKICDKKNIKLIVFYFPVEPQIYSDINWSKIDYPQRQLEKITKELSIPYFDLLPHLKRNKDRDILIDQCHFEIEGNNILAEIIFKTIQENSDIFKGL